MTAATTLHQLITAEVEHPDLKQLASDPATTLADLRFDGVARTHLAMEIEDTFKIHFMDCVIQGWSSVADIQASVTRAMAMQELSDLGQEMERG